MQLKVWRLSQESKGFQPNLKLKILKMLVPFLFSSKRPRRDRGRADAAFVVADDGDDVVHVVGDFHEVEIAGTDKFIFF